jgi:hypothetical protein
MVLVVVVNARGPIPTRARVEVVVLQDSTSRTSSLVLRDLRLQGAKVGHEVEVEADRGHSVFDYNLGSLPATLPVSLIPPGVGPPEVGARLQQFASRWKAIDPDSWVLQTVTKGYELEFTSRPLASTVIRPTPLPSSGPKRQALLAEVKALVEKKAVYPLPKTILQPGFSAIFFLAPKKSGEWRPIINLRPLNQFIVPQRFRMESLSCILNANIKGSWTTSIDLKDAYLHVPVHRDHHRWLRFSILGQPYAFRCLPFGLSTAPRVFTRVVMSVAAFLRRRGITIFMYLDDWLVVAETYQQAVNHTRFVLQITQHLGFVVNCKKSHLEPTQSPTYLGAVLDLQMGVARPSQERVVTLIREVSALRNSASAEVKTWVRCLGYMASLVDIVPWCRMRMRPIQWHLSQFYVQSRHSLSHVVPVQPSLHKHLEWWMKDNNLLKGVRFPKEPHQVVLTTDASNLGWGGHIGSLTTSGVWTQEHSSLHINMLELMAVFNSLRAFLHIVKGRKVLVQTDNATVVAYLNKQGGTRSRSLCQLTIELLCWGIEYDILLTAVHIPGEDNHIADSLSRGKTVLPSEWSLSREVVQAVFQVLGEPQIDLFANSANHQLPVYCSRVQDPRAYAVDALSITWKGVFAYAFPPIPLLHQVLRKVEMEQCTVLLIAPFWPRQPWFARLVSLLVDTPLLLPADPDLLRLPATQARFHNIDGLRLTAWMLSNSDIRRRDFLTRQHSMWQQEDDQERSRFTLHVSRCTVSGVQTEVLIHPQPLLPK